MFLVYGDESMDEAQNRVCAVAALVGIDKDWESLEAKWKDLHGDIPFHANDCESNRGNFAVGPTEDADAKNKQNKELYRNSVLLLAESEIGGFGSALDLKSQREAFRPPNNPPLYYQPFIDVLYAVYNLLESNSGFSKLTFDSRIQSDHNAALIYAGLRENNSEWQQRFADEISFVSSRLNVRIQIADLFAREAMKDLDNEVGPKKRPTRKSWECLRDTGRFFIKRTGMEYFDPASRNMDQVREIFHIGPGDFEQWLKDRNRQWNHTNWYEFLQWAYNRASHEQKDEYLKLKIG
jgi:hypothetical protein